MSRVFTNRLRLALAALCAAALGACASPIRVSSEFDPKADFSAIHSFAWAPGADPSGDAARKIKPTTSAHIRSEIARTLAQKGIRESPPAAADALVSFEVAVNAMAETVNSPGAPGTGASGRPPTRDWVYRYDLGTLTVELTDRATSRSLWRGAAQTELQHDAKLEQASQAVAKMFADFPPPKR